MAEQKLNLFQKLQKARVELQEMNLKTSTIASYTMLLACWE